MIDASKLKSMGASIGSGKEVMNITTLMTMQKHLLNQHDYQSETVPSANPVDEIRREETCP